MSNITKQKVSTISSRIVDGLLKIQNNYQQQKYFE